MAKKIAVFGGTFDPPHNGHIHLIVSLQREYRFDEVWIIPALQNPVKKAVVAAEHRLAMARLAFEPLSWCRVLDIEYQRSVPSYTADTLTQLMISNPDFEAAERFLIVGPDIAQGVWEWKDANVILQTAYLVVGKVGGFALSSTLVRRWLGEGTYVGHLIPESVRRYIQQKELYGGK